MMLDYSIKKSNFQRKVHKPSFGLLEVLNWSTPALNGARVVAIHGGLISLSQFTLGAPIASQ